MIKQYLYGNLIDNNNDILEDLDVIKFISTMYTMDRLFYFKSSLNIFSDINIFDRYTTSNIIHMGSKLNDFKLIDDYITWLEDLEYNKLGIPKPDKVIYLDISYLTSIKNIKSMNKVYDIHETEDALKRVEHIKNYIIDKCGWTRIVCDDKNNNMRPIDDITHDIKKEINIILKGDD